MQNWHTLDTDMQHSTSKSVIHKRDRRESAQHGVSWDYAEVELCCDVKVMSENGKQSLPPFVTERFRVGLVFGDNNTVINWYESEGQVAAVMDAVKMHFGLTEKCLVYSRETQEISLHKPYRRVGSRFYSGVYFVPQGITVYVSELDYFKRKLRLLCDE